MMVNPSSWSTVVRSSEHLQAVCDAISSMAKSESIDLDALYDLIDQYNELGFVPKQVIRKIRKRFDGVMEEVFASTVLTDDDKSDVKMNMQVNRMRSGPHGDAKVQRKENALRRKITALENDLNTYKTNIEFFASSKNADAMKADFQKRIDAANDELKEFRGQLKQLRNA